ncbi:MAG TPA: hypothetical protein VH637_14705 [Streptosporangiaceae bacterium]
MLLTLSTTRQPATDLGYLLHKNPARQHTAELGFGTAHVLYPAEYTWPGRISPLTMLARIAWPACSRRLTGRSDLSPAAVSGSGPGLVTGGLAGPGAG